MPTPKPQTAPAGEVALTPQQKANLTKQRKKEEAERLASNSGEKQEVKPSPEKSVSAPPVSDGKASVITELVKQGYSYDQASEMVNGTGKGKKAAPKAFDPSNIDPRTQKLIDGDDSDLPPLEDAPDKTLPVVNVQFTTREGLENYLFELEQKIVELRADRSDAVYVLPIPFSKRLYEFLLADTLREGCFRRDTNWTEARMIEMIFKQRLALDPTKGGSVRPSSSGPKSSYDAKAGGWG